MKKTSLSLAGIVAIIILFAIAVLVQNRQNPTTEIRVGAVLGLTGYAADDSLGVKRGIDLAVSDLAKEGIMVDVKYVDDATDPKQTVSAVRNLVATYKPQAMMGPIWSFLEAAATPVLTESKLVNFAPADTSEFTPGGPYVFHGAVKNARIAPVAAEWLTEHKVKKVAIFVGKDGWGDSVSRAFVDAVNRASGTVVLNEAIITGDAAASTMATGLAKAKSLGAQAILFTGYDDAALTLVKRRLELNFKVPVLAHTREYQRLLSSKTVFPEQMDGIDYLSADTSLEFIAKFKAAYGIEPGNYSDRAYDGFMMLVHAIRNTPNAAGDEIATYLRTNPYTGYAGTYEFDAKGDLTGGDWVIRPVVE